MVDYVRAEPKHRAFNFSGVVRATDILMGESCTWLPLRFCAFSPDRSRDYVNRHSKYTQ